MSGSTTKKVVVDRFDRAPLRGFVNPHVFLQSDGVELLSQDGSLTVVPFQQIKAVSFVRDIEGQGIFGERREFHARPKSAGLWVELTFRGGERLQGILANDLLLLEPGGFAISPPEVAGNTQRVWVPRSALIALAVLGVVGSPLRRRRPPGEAAPTQQITLFGE